MALTEGILFQEKPAEPPLVDIPGASAVVGKDGAVRATVPTTDPPPDASGGPGGRPAWLPPEYESPEKYIEALKANASAGKTVEAAPVVNDQTATDQVTKAGLDMNVLEKEYREKGGQLSPESLKKLEAAGIGKGIVDAYVEGRKAQAEQREARITQAVGGKESLQATLDWAGKNLPEADIKAANAILAANDEAAVKLLLSGLNSRRLSQQGREPSFVGGQAAPVNVTQGYESNAQMLEDMKNPKYDKDPAFRRKVMQRIAAASK